MYYALVSFNNVPKIGFAHHFQAENYICTRQKMENSIEIVYIKEGALTIKLDGETMVADPGSVFILPRTIPFSFEAGINGCHTHCSVQLISDFEFEVVSDIGKIPSDYGGLILPLVSHQDEHIRKQLNSIVSGISISRELNEFSASLCALGILEEISTKFKGEFLTHFKKTSLLNYKIKKYVSEHLSENISLLQIAEKLGKTSIYLNSVFKNETGITIHRYINSEKIRFISELMTTKGMDFKGACESAGIADVSYGYRLFKKQMGITPSEYKNSRHFLN